MYKKFFVVDLDGVLYDHLGAAVEYIRNRWNHIIKPGQIRTGNFATFTDIEEINVDLIHKLRDGNFFSEIKPLPWAVEAVCLLKKYGDIHAITRRPDVLRTATRVSCSRDFGDCINTIWHSRNGPRLAKEWHATNVFEDNAQLAQEYAKKFITTYLVSTPYAQDYKPNRFLKPVDNILEAAKEIDEKFSSTSWDDI